MRYKVHIRNKARVKKKEIQYIKNLVFLKHTNKLYSNLVSK